VAKTRREPFVWWVIRCRRCPHREHWPMPASAEPSNWTCPRCGTSGAADDSRPMPQTADEAHEHAARPLGDVPWPP
jgi:hypothetical protein